VLKDISNQISFDYGAYIFEYNYRGIGGFALLHLMTHIQKHNIHASMMVDEAEKLYNKVLKHCINKMVEHLETTNEACDSKSSPLSLLPRREL
jgi:hypothetical protein